MNAYTESKSCQSGSNKSRRSPVLFLDVASDKDWGSRDSYTHIEGFNLFNSSPSRITNLQKMPQLNP